MRSKLIIANLFLPALLTAPVVAQDEPPAVVRYSEAKVQSLPRSVDLPGTVVSPRISTVAGEVAGLVTKLTVREGDRVEKGQLLAELRRERLELDLAAAQAQLQEDETRRKLALINLERSRELFEKNVFSRQQLDDASFEYEALGKRIERLQAEMARLEDELQQTYIHAPFRGVVVSLQTELGEWLQEGGAVLDLMSIDDLEVEVQVPERHFPDIRMGMRVSIEFESLQKGSMRSSVHRIIPRADPKARTFPVRARLPSGLRAGVGMVARVSLALGAVNQATLIPKDALVRQGAQEFVFVINDDSTVRRVEVRSGGSLGDWVAVDGGITEGDRVVTRGNERLRPGQSVAATPMEYVLP